MSRSITIPVTLVMGIIGGVALVQIRPQVAFHFNSGVKEYTDYDVQKSIVARIAAEKNLEDAALKRVAAEQDAEKAARWQETRAKIGVQNETGEIYSLQHYAFFCKAKALDKSNSDIVGHLFSVLSECAKMQKTTICPRTGEAGGWKSIYFELKHGALYIC